ncbi:MAG TPA: YeeE/YedE family protein [Kiritimatiellia bacterium]|nr:YeeE/YedE family protein [Kiritimatiellia bacterium]HMO97914.1 YeeE/YedE family protein [Kiritimatiellia bacterium]HMP95567.1 YeeE/YedE family protein [Kiritimatiellia bacterium]
MIPEHWLSALIGGICIGASATVLLLMNGRIAGISGISGRVLAGRGAEPWALLFLAGLLIGGAIYEYGLAPTPTPVAAAAPWLMLGGGLLVGIGSRMGHGCTSGHGVCGLGRFSRRSLIAVLVFMTTAFITVYLVRHTGIVGGG